jgi:hypothetical protein
MSEGAGMGEPNRRDAPAGKDDRPSIASSRSAFRSAADPRRERALNRAGAVRLVRAIRPFGVLRRDALAQVAGAGRWPAGAFQGALDAALELGLLEHVAFGFYQESRSKRASIQEAPKPAAPPDL